MKISGVVVGQRVVIKCPNCLETDEYVVTRLNTVCKYCNEEYMQFIIEELNDPYFARPVSNPSPIRHRHRKLEIEHTESLNPFSKNHENNEQSQNKVNKIKKWIDGILMKYLS